MLHSRLFWLWLWRIPIVLDSELLCLTEESLLCWIRGFYGWLWRIPTVLDSRLLWLTLKNPYCVGFEAFMAATMKFLFMLDSRLHWRWSWISLLYGIRGFYGYDYEESILCWIRGFYGCDYEESLLCLIRGFYGCGYAESLLCLIPGFHTGDCPGIYPRYPRIMFWKPR
jgi:hypothetical protein